MLLFLEMNEVNFEYIQYYVDRGGLPNFKSLLERHGHAETISEKAYEELEPWIQWVTAHTGLTLAEHGIRHLGDVVYSDIEQIWEILAQKGLRVGAISPMNGKCRSKSLAFFVPDPWTNTDVIASPMVKRLYAAIKQAVNDNAESRITARSLVDLAMGMISTARIRTYRSYFELICGSIRRPWLRSVVLDRLLADLFIKSVRRHHTDFASLFLNAAAHIQHHYIFSSSAYTGKMRNPEGYVGIGMDPLWDVYAAYDAILGDIIESFPAARVMLATGLHQDPHPSLTYYWRLRDHGDFLRKLGIDFDEVEPRMSRDFAIRFKGLADASLAKARLASVVTASGEALFEIEDQGENLFVMLSYPHQIGKGFAYRVDNRWFGDLDRDVVFVALKNGQHNGIGYFSDTMSPERLAGVQFPLRDIPAKILAACSI
jgi:hypothetical protein